MRLHLRPPRALLVAAGLALALALATLLPAPPAHAARRAAAARPVVFGTGGWSFPTDGELRSLGRDGLRTWRLTVSWASVSPRPGVMDFSGYDHVLRAAARRRIEVLAVLTGCPAWMCPGATNAPVTPAAAAGFQAFVRAAVARWGTHGSVWRGRGRGRAGRLPVRYWQVLNEVNGAEQWAPRPSPAGYAALLRRTAATIRRTDRRAQVVLAGLGEKMTIWMRDYLPALYRQPGFRRSFDVVAPEGYAPRPRDVARILDLTRRIMRRFHDAHKPAFITEMSWASGGPAHTFTTTPAGQAARLRASWRLLAACRARWDLRRVYWFSYSDPPSSVSPSGDYWGIHNGLLDAAGRPKPAWNAFVRFLRPAVAARSAGRCPL